jgi:hypothetical protein
MLDRAVPLHIYHRHRQQCEGGHRQDSRLGDLEERKSGWKKCFCFIFASGTLGRKFGRKYTGKTNWEEAKVVAAAWELADSWDSKAAARMTIQIKRPGVEMLINQRLRSGLFKDAEDLILWALQSSSLP